MNTWTCFFFLLCVEQNSFLHFGFLPFFPNLSWNQSFFWKSEEDMLQPLDLSDCSVVEGLIKHQSNTFSALSFHLIDLNWTLLQEWLHHWMLSVTPDETFLLYLFYKFIYWDVEINVHSPISLEREGLSCSPSCSKYHKGVFNRCCSKGENPAHFPLILSIFFVPCGVLSAKCEDACWVRLLRCRRFNS